MNVISAFLAKDKESYRREALLQAQRITTKEMNVRFIGKPRQMSDMLSLANKFADFSLDASNTKEMSQMPGILEDFYVYSSTSADHLRSMHTITAQISSSLLKLIG